MNTHTPAIDLSCVAVIVPALNEARNLEELLPILSSIGVGQVIVGDNGSTDTTRSVSIGLGADCVTEPCRGYGAACFAAMGNLGDGITVVVFMDADLSDDTARLVDLVAPILRDQLDLVIGARVASMRASGSMTAGQRIANAFFPLLMRMGWGYPYTDMGPFRAIRRRCLDRLDMRDRKFGWTIEMQIRAVEEGLRIAEINVPCLNRRHGKSKISGHIIGAVVAAYWIISTCGCLWLTKHRRL